MCVLKIHIPSLPPPQDMQDSYHREMRETKATGALPKIRTFKKGETRFVYVCVCVCVCVCVWVCVCKQLQVFILTFEQQ